MSAAKLESYGKRSGTCNTYQMNLAARILTNSLMRNYSLHNALLKFRSVQQLLMYLHFTRFSSFRWRLIESRGTPGGTDYVSGAFKHAEMSGGQESVVLEYIL